ncbi:MAG: hypothetical protein KJ977_04175, partial [Candidatus Omnitrophica bacterium]|nr:hypothetical protein [Candidatus Omnitrophota bacterium]
VSPQSKDFICGLSEKLSVGRILNIIDLFIGAKELSQRLNTVRIPLELALIKHAYPKEPGQPAVLTAPGPKVNPANPSPKKPEDKPLKKSREPDLAIEGVDDFDLDDDPAPKASDPASKEVQQPQGPQDNTYLQPILAKWPQIIAYMQKIRAGLASHLAFAQPVSSRGRCVTIAFSRTDSFHKEMVEGTKNSKFIEEAITKITSQALGVKFTLADLPDRPQLKISEPDKNSQVSPQASSAQASGEEDGFLNNLLDAFGGKFHSEDQ